MMAFNNNGENNECIMTAWHRGKAAGEKAAKSGVAAA